VSVLVLENGGGVLLLETGAYVLLERQVDEEDSRGGFRYHAQVALARLTPVRARAASIRVGTQASATLRGVSATARTRWARVKGSAKAAAVPAVTTGRLARVRVLADAQLAPAGLQAARATGAQVRAAAAAQASARAVQLVASARGRAQVEIGPDLVEQELEEILFLLEVA
jgi:hypothetical protein